ncbi:MAG: hypothetical protein JKY53_07595 [Flavobacteriales bacterium]|nr:hypothetical protein [Flavobacteriales bacterium]
MKKITLFILTIASVSLLTTSCSKCYECTTEHEVEVITPDTSYITTEESTEDFCTANSDEVKQKEDEEGATCTAI